MNKEMYRLLSPGFFIIVMTIIPLLLFKFYLQPAKIQTQQERVLEWAGYLILVIVIVVFF